MKNSGTLDFFSLLVIGDNPDEQIMKFDTSSDIETPYIIYKYTDVGSIRKNKVKFYTELLSKTKDQNIRDKITQQLWNLTHTSDIDYYLSLSEYHSMDEDRNIVSTENPSGKWLTCDKGGRIYSNYLIDINGKPTSSDKKDQLDWRKFHLNEERVKMYDKIWELCVNNTTPKNESDRTIVSNIEKIPNYFDSFNNKEMFINYSTSFWTYAVIVNGEWLDMENELDFDWVINYYNRFIKNLNENELITIYECTR